MTMLTWQPAVQGHSPEMVVDGRTLSRILGTDFEPLLAELANMCSGVVVCRASPSQKATIVRMMKRFQVAQLSGTVSPFSSTFPLGALARGTGWPFMPAPCSQHNIMCSKRGCAETLTV